MKIIGADHKIQGRSMRIDHQCYDIDRCDKSVLWFVRGDEARCAEACDNLGIIMQKCVTPLALTA